MVPEKLVSELDFVKALARELSSMARSRALQVRPQEKSNLSYVTDLDHDVERLVRTRLSERFPADRLTGEELPPEGDEGPRCWSIDPIDGTGNLVHRVPLWAISIGLIESGEPVLGVIAIPPLNELYWAVKGGGAWRDDEPILAAGDADSFHDQDNVCVSTNALRTLDPRTLPGRLRDLGTACSELAFTACGRLAACTFLGEGRHDVAAGAVIASEAGCSFGTVEGEVLTPAQFVERTPVKTPTFVTRPRRLRALMRLARRLD